ncbi:MAG: hypothetical protein JWN76_131 [Chitinophagaceae bacterium]|nr:hypothetical protein [Chitinophagaceae bacterium]
MKFLFILAFVSFTLGLTAQNPAGIGWNDRKLKWEDFKGMADNRSSFKAHTTSNVALDYSVSGRQVIIESNCLFIPGKSWVKTGTDKLLTHEQLHFDIAESGRRKFMDVVARTQFIPGKVEQQIEKLFNTLLDENQELQNKYDEETDHGLNETRQQEWEMKIRNELTNLPETRQVEGKLR